MRVAAASSAGLFNLIPASAQNSFHNFFCRQQLRHDATRCHALINITISHLDDRPHSDSLQHNFLHFGGNITHWNCSLLCCTRPHTNSYQNHVKILCRLEVNLDYKIYVSFNLRILGRFCWI